MSIATPTPDTCPTTDAQAGDVVRVGLYQRKPTPFESDRLLSYVTSQPGWRISLRSTDFTTGATLKRPGLQQVLEAARAGAIDVLVVPHVYSLSRTAPHLAYLLTTLTSRGVRVVSAFDPAFDTEATYGTFLIGAVSAVAEIEQAGALADRRDRHCHDRQSVHASQLGGQP